MSQFTPYQESEREQAKAMAIEEIENSESFLIITVKGGNVSHAGLMRNLVHAMAISMATEIEADKLRMQVQSRDHVKALPPKPPPMPPPQPGP